MTMTMNTNNFNKTLSLLLLLVAYIITTSLSINNNNNIAFPFGYKVYGFIVNPLRPSTSRQKSFIILQMGKKMKNKQAELLKKLELARQQNRQKENGPQESNDEEQLSDEQIKERNDRLRFEELLKNNVYSASNSFKTGSYLTDAQEEEEISAAQAGVDRLFEGDPAPTEPFEALVSVKTDNALGPNGAARLIPWLKKKNNSINNDYLIILCDPRMKSFQLRDCLKDHIRGELSPLLLQKLIIINADTPAENRRWLKKNNLSSVFDVYSDEKMEWMRAYTALGDKRWSMSVFIIANEKVQRIARDVIEFTVGDTITNAVKSMDNGKKML